MDSLPTLLPGNIKNQPFFHPLITITQINNLIHLYYMVTDKTKDSKPKMKQKSNPAPKIGTVTESQTQFRYSTVFIIHHIHHDFK